MVEILHENHSASLVRKLVCDYNWIRSDELTAGSLYGHTLKPGKAIRWPLHTQKPEDMCTNSSADKS